MATVTDILNIIRANGTTEYSTRVPEATRTNIDTVANAILAYTSTQNEFLNAIVNKIAMTIVRNKIAQNPLRVLKSGGVPLGKDIEEIFTNMQSATAYDATGANLLQRNIPDVKAIYHRLNRRDMYKVTISDAQLRTAFTSDGKMNELIQSIVNSLYSGDNYDEFVLMKNTLADCVVDGKITNISTPEFTGTQATDEASSKALVKAIRTMSGLFQFPSSAYNTYFANKPASDTSGKPVVTWTPKEDQILLIRSDILSNIDVDVLAQAFNIDKVNFLARTLEVDSFGAAADCYAILSDKSFLQVYDNFQEMREFYNGEGLYWNYFWHHWQTYSFSYFANAVAFVKPPVTP